MTASKAHQVLEIILPKVRIRKDLRIEVQIEVGTAGVMGSFHSED